MDATRGFRKYGLKLATVHVIDEENAGKCFLGAVSLSIPRVISSFTKFGRTVSKMFHVHPLPTCLHSTTEFRLM
jgi:hypothetical protein